MTKELKLDKALDENLKPIKVDGESSAIEISTQSVKINNKLTTGLIEADEITTNNLKAFVREGEYLYFENTDDYADPHFIRGDESGRFLLGCEDETFMLVDKYSGGGKEVTFFTGTGVSMIETDVVFDGTLTDVNFINGNKKRLELTGDITNLRFQFPVYACNCQIVVLQDGTGGHSINGYIVLNASGGVASGGVLKWAGGSAPTITSTADKSDIISLYWSGQGQGQISYAIISQNF